MKSEVRIAYEIITAFDLAPIRCYKAGEEVAPLLFRVEILRSVANPRLYSGRLWRKEFMRVQPSFSADLPTEYADERIMIEDCSIFEQDFVFSAEDPQDAQKKIMSLIADRFPIGDRSAI